jgi:hypothetical protein
MTRKDYKAIGMVILNMRRSRLRLLQTADLYDEFTLNALVNKLADLFEADNPRFNRGQFVSFCNSKEEVA